MLFSVLYKKILSTPLHFITCSLAIDPEAHHHDAVFGMNYGATLVSACCDLFFGYVAHFIKIPLYFTTFTKSRAYNTNLTSCKPLNIMVQQFCSCVYLPVDLLLPTIKENHCAYKEQQNLLIKTSNFIEIQV